MDALTTFLLCYLSPLPHVTLHYNNNRMDEQESIVDAESNKYIITQNNTLCRSTSFLTITALDSCRSDDSILSYIIQISFFHGSNCDFLMLLVCKVHKSHMRRVVISLYGNNYVSFFEVFKRVVACSSVGEVFVLPIIRCYNCNSL